MKRTSISVCGIALACLLTASCATGEGADAGATSSPDAPSSQLCVVRHAQSYGNLKGAPPGLTTEQLNTLTEKGRVQAKKLGAEVPRPVTALYASPTGRTRTTAELLGVDAPIGLTGTLSKIEDGESLDDARERVVEIIQRSQSDASTGGHVVLVTHGDIASLLIGELNATPLSERRRAHKVELGEAVCLPMPASDSD
jgi:broad specificity phosphatase PhoE